MKVQPLVTSQDKQTSKKNTDRKVGTQLLALINLNNMTKLLVHVKETRKRLEVLALSNVAKYHQFADMQVMGIADA